MTDLMDAKFEDKVKSRTNLSEPFVMYTDQGNTVPSAPTSLYPLGALEEQSPDELWSELVRAKKDKKARSYGSYGSFMRVWSPWMDQLLDSSLHHYKAMNKHEHRLVSIMLERGWPAAEYYHFKAFQNQRDGVHDLYRHPVDPYAMIDMVSRHPLKTTTQRGATTTNRTTVNRTDRNSRPAGEGWIWCPHHKAWGKHTVAACSKVSNGGGGGASAPQ